MSGRYDPDALARAEEELVFLRRSLADLDRERAAGELDEADHASLRADYERRLAAAEGAVAERRDAVATPTPRRRGPLVAGVVVVALAAVGAGIGVAASSGGRQPGQSITGEVPATTAQLIAEATQLASEGRYADALRTFDEVLVINPDNVDALAERGLLLASTALIVDSATLAEQGRISIEKAIRLEPTNPRNDFYLGIVLELMGEDEGADAAIAAALAKNPVPRLREQIEGWDAGKASRRAGDGMAPSPTTTAPPG